MPSCVYSSNTVSLGDWRADGCYISCESYPAMHCAVNCKIIFPLGTKCITFVDYSRGVAVIRKPIDGGFYSSLMVRWVPMKIQAN